MYEVRGHATLYLPPIREVLCHLCCAQLGTLPSRPKRPKTAQRESEEAVQQ